MDGHKCKLVAECPKFGHMSGIGGLAVGTLEPGHKDLLGGPT